MNGDDEELVLEEALRRLLAERAAAIEPEPDLAGLMRRVDVARKNRPLAKAAAAAAIVLGAAGVGGLVGALTSSSNGAQAAFTARGSDLGGRLPTGPQKSGKSPPVLRPDAHGSAGPSTVSFIRRSVSGARLLVAELPLSPVAISSGTSTAGCFSSELVSTAAGYGGERTGGVGVVALQPLSPDGLELLDSGTAPLGNGRQLWWATVAVGRAVARVAAEPPLGATDAMRPSGGLAVLGGVGPDGIGDGYFSVVAESPEGQSLHSIGFLAGWGPEASGALLSPRSSASGCAKRAPASSRVTSFGTGPSSPLLAGASVVAAFQEAYATGLPAGEIESLSAVEHGSSLGRSLKGPSAGLSWAAATSQITDGVQRTKVLSVVFLSAKQADVVFKTKGGRFVTGSAVLGETGSWKVTEATYCGDVEAGLAGAPRSLRAGCYDSSGR